VPFATQRPDFQGDQLVFYYDARESFTSFLTVRDAVPTPDELKVRITFYSGGFSVPFSTEVALHPGQLRVVDVGALRAAGLPAQPGIALATAIDGTGAPIISRGLTGSFTVANLQTGSGWGSPAAARSAITVGGSDAVPQAVGPPPGTVIDGTIVALRPIQPNELDLAAYYDPDDLAPVGQGGNQLIFVSFADDPGVPYSASPAPTSWDVSARRNDGSSLAETTFGVSGVVVTDLASVVGPAVNGAGGSIRFFSDGTAGPISRMIFFAEALGTIGTGYMLPVPGLA
jgi:hypothetical protein